MAKVGLTGKYRPQTFNEIVGQDFIKKILSRASKEDKPASAYLFSGTRGVGKTTAARVLAKAVNCLKGPDFEPCNQCSNCSQITKGVFPDVLEIDAASHTGVDNVRKLREDVSYMPMMGRYKIVIIDEAHMLSNAAFNALLKTLEEPPKHCVFIMATTAPDKFPPTVISRCQHYVFRMVGLKDLVSHLESVLNKEEIKYDPRAVHLIAVRGAGSVRDSMSILGQVVAIGGERIEPENVRQVLGLAGQEVYVNFFEAILNRDLPAIHSGINNILDQGLDISFFLQEFASCWRNLFLLSQSGKAAGNILNLPSEEIQYWHDLALKVPAPLIHAGWQMVIEESKSILKSHEPSLALELLFFNLAYLPDLLPVGEYDAMPAIRQVEAQDYGPESRDHSIPEQKPADPVEDPEQMEYPGAEISGTENFKDWPGFVEFIQTKLGPDDSLLRMLGNCEARLEGDLLVLACKKEFIFDNIRKNGRHNIIIELVKQYYGPEIRIEFENNGSKDESSFKDKALNHPTIKKIIHDFDAKIIEIKKINSQ